jgi:2,3-bisphosphoglycerate-dependent phosphoglycerate mutase
MTEFLIIRHCESTGQEPGAPLTANGLRQAERLAVILKDHPIDLIVSSPFLRARDTIDPLSRLRKLKLEIDPRLSERRLANPPVEDWREYIRRSFVEPDSRAPGGESGFEVLERGWAAIRDAVNSPAHLPVLVTHGHFLALVLNSLDSNFGYADWESLANPDIFRLHGSSLTDLHFNRVIAV